MPLNEIWELCNPKPNVQEGHKILCWSKDGDFIKSYKNMSEAARDWGIKPSHISMNINGKVKFLKKKTIYFTKAD